jgi:hypothetical protein
MEKDTKLKVIFEALINEGKTTEEAMSLVMSVVMRRRFELPGQRSGEKVTKSRHSIPEALSQKSAKTSFNS